MLEVERDMNGKYGRRGLQLDCQIMYENIAQNTYSWEAYDIVFYNDSFDMETHCDIAL